MGNKLKQSSLFTKTAMSQIGTVSICPNCDQQFPANTTYENFDQHVTQCLLNFRPTDQERLRMQRRKRSKDSIDSKNSQDDDQSQKHDYVTIQVYIKRYENSSDSKTVLTNPQRIGKHKQASLLKIHKNQHIQASNPHSTPHSQSPHLHHKYKWTKSQLTYSEPLLSSLAHAQIIKQATAYKIIWFHNKLANNRITWKSGSQKLTFHPQHIVRDSLILKNINLYKQLKIMVINDIVHDAGGLLRQWANMLVKELIGRFQLFIRNKLGYYVLNPQYCSVQRLNSPVQWHKQNKSVQKQQQKNNKISQSSNKQLEQLQMKQPTQSKPNTNLNKITNNDLQQLELYKNYYYNNMYNNDDDQFEQQFDQYAQYFNQQLQLQQKGLKQIKQQQSSQKQNNFDNINRIMNQIDQKQSYFNGVIYRDLYQLFACLLVKVFIQKVNIQINFDWIFLTQLSSYNKSKNYDSLPKLPPQTILPLLSTYDPQLHKSLLYLTQLQQSLQQTPKQSSTYSQKIQQLHSLCLTFSIPSTKYFPQQNLITNGHHIQVKDIDQLKTYIKLVTNYYYNVLHASQYKIIFDKFYHHSNGIRGEIFQNLFNCEQLELLLNGVQGDDINVKDWQNGTEYKEPYHDKHKVIGYFWSTVAKMTGEEKMRLLKFVTGASRLPIYGFKNLETNRGETSHFVIQSIKYDKKTSAFPQAHTCFNRLVLPIYPNQLTLAQSLRAVINSNFDGVWGKQ